MNEEKEVQRLLKQAQSYFGPDETIFIFKCKKCKKLDPVPGFILDEQIGFLKFIKKKTSYKMDCPFCGSSMIPIENFK